MDKFSLSIIQPNNIEELNELITVFEIVFEMGNFERPSQEHLKNLLNKENFYAITAKTENKIVAGLTFYVIEQYYSEKPLAYIYDLAVLSQYQRKGIGKMLIDFTNNYCKKNGFEEVFVQADKIDDYAIDFYRTTKPTDEEQVVHFYYKFSGN
ncbi:GNAT family N-acetyltransferase [Belliella marina]|uniref:GNAT family N-acetyltransferase n=1 Tax=Belliella marina TaxID=1644146 RepID=A0ABW4VPG3_9BACT